MKQTFRKSNMKGLFKVIFAMQLVCGVLAKECSKYHYEEQTLTKIIRLEHRLDLLEEKINHEDYKVDTENECTQCPDGWIQYKGSCYIIVEDKLPFLKARAYCQKLDADLVHIDNADENAFLRNHLRTLKGIDFWIGLTDVETEGVFRWVDDNSRAIFTDWYPSQPDHSRNEDCAHYKAI